ncbi:hypothetical protein EDD86DRAFT_199551 [Gorgonomyces haynaldii]|nr:hypothetical protein EDD86DRAFT_199551 [Gorgonomyces haynaldii]
MNSAYYLTRTLVNGNTTTINTYQCATSTCNGPCSLFKSYQIVDPCYTVGTPATLSVSSSAVSLSTSNWNSAVSANSVVSSTPVAPTVLYYQTVTETLIYNSVQNRVTSYTQSAIFYPAFAMSGNSPCANAPTGRASIYDASTQIVHSFIGYTIGNAATGCVDTTSSSKLSITANPGNVDLTGSYTGNTLTVSYNSISSGISRTADGGLQISGTAASKTNTATYSSLIAVLGFATYCGDVSNINSIGLYKVYKDCTNLRSNVFIKSVIDQTLLTFTLNQYICTDSACDSSCYLAQTVSLINTCKPGNGSSIISIPSNGVTLKTDSFISTTNGLQLQKTDPLNPVNGINFRLGERFTQYSSYSPVYRLVTYNQDDRWNYFSTDAGDSLCLNKGVFGTQTIANLTSQNVLSCTGNGVVSKIGGACFSQCSVLANFTSNVTLNVPSDTTSTDDYSSIPFGSNVKVMPANLFTYGRASLFLPGNLGSDSSNGRTTMIQSNTAVFSRYVVDVSFQTPYCGNISETSIYSLTFYRVYDSCTKIMENGTNEFYANHRLSWDKTGALTISTMTCSDPTCSLYCWFARNRTISSTCLNNDTIPATKYPTYFIVNSTGLQLSASLFAPQIDTGPNVALIASLTVIAILGSSAAGLFFYKKKHPEFGEKAIDNVKLKMKNIKYAAKSMKVKSAASLGSGDMLSQPTNDQFKGTGEISPGTAMAPTVAGTPSGGFPDNKYDEKPLPAYPPPSTTSAYPPQRDSSAYPPQPSAPQRQTSAVSNPAVRAPTVRDQSDTPPKREAPTRDPSVRQPRQSDASPFRPNPSRPSEKELSFIANAGQRYLELTAPKENEEMPQTIVSKSPLSDFQEFVPERLD